MSYRANGTRANGHRANGNRADVVAPFTGPRTLMEGSLTHRMGQWRETKPKDMLHLEDIARIRMGKTCVGYYKAIYRITECRARSKNEGLKLSRENRI